MNTLKPTLHTGYIIGAWAVLMVLTAASWWAGIESTTIGFGHQAIMVGILVLTFAKIFVVGHSFMELRLASSWLVRLFSVWCVAVCIVLSTMYLTLV